MVPALAHGGVVEGDPLRPQAEGLTLPHLLIPLGGMDEGFGGDAPPVEAGAAHGVPLHQGGAQPQLGGPDGGGVAAGAAPDDDEVPAHAWPSGGVYRSTG